MNQLEDKKLKIAVISRYFPNYRDAVFKTLSRRPEMKIEFISGKAPEDRLIRESATEGIARRFVRVLEVSIPKTKNSITWRCGTLTALFSRKYDVLVLTNDVLAPDVWLACLLSRMVGVRICIWGQGISRPPNRLRNALRYLLTRLAHAAVYYSGGGKQYWVDRGIKSEKLFVAYNALDTSKQIQVRDSVTGSDMVEFLKKNELNGKVIVCYLGRLISLKRPDIFVESIALALSSELNLVGVLIGDGPERKRLVELAEKRGITHAIRFIGESYDEELLGRYLLASRAIMLPAFAGLAIQHAAVYGTPVILGELLHSHGPEQEIVVDGVTGLRCTSDSVDAFASCILRLIHDSDLRNKLSIAVRREIDEKYNTARMAQGFIDAIRYCMKK